MINNNQYDHYDDNHLINGFIELSINLSCHDICLSKVTKGQIQMCKMFVLSDQKNKIKIDIPHTRTQAPAQIHTLPGSLGVCEPEQFLHGPTKEHKREKNEMHNRSA